MRTFFTTFEDYYLEVAEDHRIRVLVDTNSWSRWYDLRAIDDIIQLGEDMPELSMAITNEGFRLSPAVDLGNGESIVFVAGKPIRRMGEYLYLEDVAKALGVSPEYVQAFFADQGDNL